MGEKQGKKSLEIVNVQNTEEYKKVEENQETKENPKAEENQETKENLNTETSQKPEENPQAGTSQKAEENPQAGTIQKAEENLQGETIQKAEENPQAEVSPKNEESKMADEGQKHEGSRNSKGKKSIKNRKKTGENKETKESDNTGDTDKAEGPEIAKVLSEAEKVTDTEIAEPEKREEERAQSAGDEETVKEELPKKGKKKTLIAVGAASFLILIGAISFLYYKGVVYYRTRFLPNTTINGIDCAGMDVDSIVTLLDAPIYEYRLEVNGRDCKSGDSGAKLGEIIAKDIGLVYTGTKEAAESFLGQQDEYKWFLSYLGSASAYHMEREVSFDRELLQTAVKKWDACKKENMQKAEDAYISDYSEELHGYEIIPETSGTELDIDRAIERIAEAITGLEQTLDVEELGCYREASVRQDDEKLTDIVDIANRWLGSKITYDWNGTEVILDCETLKDWISVEKNEAVLDEEQVAAFVKAQASAHDTYGKKKKFVTTLGVELTLVSRNYGWKTDVKGETAELLELIRQGSVVDREPIYSVTAMEKGANDIGDSYVEADLTNQHLYLYQDGAIVLETDFVSGTMISTYDCVTPEGIFGLSYKTTNAVLRGATYATPVSYWMPFYGNYGMHDANWRGHFGGEIYKTNGSHGCINLPVSMAAQIYPYVSTGFPVICYYYGGAPYMGPPAEPVAPIDESTVWVEPEEE